MAHAAVTNLDAVKVASPAPFPARSRQAAGFVNGTCIDVLLTQFVDKMLMTIVQDGRLAHWIHVPLEHPDPGVGDVPFSVPSDEAEADGSHLLPMPHLTATTIFGAASGDHETLGQLIATQIASAITTKHPTEKRLLVVGLGLKQGSIGREAFLGILALAVRCI